MRNAKAQLSVCGFTLIELLVVMAILGILATVGLGAFRTSQMKSRDAKRKADLGQIQRALEMYLNDKGSYPETEDLVWGEPLRDPLHPETIYIKELPQDPSGSQEYCYQQVDSKTYRLYAKLENSQDPNCLDIDCTPSRSCGGGTYNYGVSSPNIIP